MKAFLPWFYFQKRILHVRVLLYVEFNFAWSSTIQYVGTYILLLHNCDTYWVHAWKYRSTFQYAYILSSSMYLNIFTSKGIHQMFHHHSLKWYLSSKVWVGWKLNRDVSWWKIQHVCIVLSSENWMYCNLAKFMRTRPAFVYNSLCTQTAGLQKKRITKGSNHLPTFFCNYYFEMSMYAS